MHSWANFTNTLDTHMANDRRKLLKIQENECEKTYIFKTKAAIIIKNNKR